MQENIDFKWYQLKNVYECTKVSACFQKTGSCAVLKLRANRHIFQHCWILHVVSVCTTCFILLRVVLLSLKLVKLLAAGKRTQHCWPTSLSIGGSCQLSCCVHFHHTWSLGRKRTPISYERIISCWPFFSRVPQAAFDKFALKRRKRKRLMPKSAFKTYFENSYLIIQDENQKNLANTAKFLALIFWRKFFKKTQF